MCGIAGILSGAAVGRDELAARATRMADALVHRGPDDAGAWVDERAGIALGHRRLSVLDLSPEGHQPMMSAGGRWVIVFNGEIYNFAEMRDALDRADGPHAWRGHSDTEVFLAACERWGVEQAVERAVGMFAMAIWDRRERALHLVRDRLGEKPLYYGYVGGALAFASEIKALRTLPGWRGEIDRDALAEFIQLSWIPAPKSIHRGILKVPPGTIVRFDQTMLRDASLPRPQRYWSLEHVVATAAREPRIETEAEATEALVESLRTAIKGQMIADVPLGAFLSGGIDSSTVVALMQSLSSRPIRTFTIGFTESAYNEAVYARAVAEHLATDHTELYVTPEEAQSVIPSLAGVYDEPFGDSSQIPTILVSRLARHHVTVSLSGDGGDELFGGYNRYFWADTILRRFAGWPAAMRRGLGRAIGLVPPSAWDRIFGMMGPVLPQRLQVSLPGDKAHKYAALLEAADEASLYERLISQWHEPGMVIGGNAHFGGEPLPASLAHVAERMMYRDTLGYLPDDILVKVDRAAMSVSLETRVPFLDHRVVQLAWRLPLGLKIRNGRGKHVLRRILHRHVPDRLIERPKQGFSIPLDQWLRGPLKEWASAMIHPARIRSQGFLAPEPIATAWSEHQSGARNWQHRLWNILMFQGWLEHVGDGTG